MCVSVHVGRLKARSWTSCKSSCWRNPKIDAQARLARTLPHAFTCNRTDSHATHIYHDTHFHLRSHQIQAMGREETWENHTVYYIQAAFLTRQAAWNAAESICYWRRLTMPQSKPDLTRLPSRLFPVRILNNSVSFKSPTTIRNG